MKAKIISFAICLLCLIYAIGGAAMETVKLPSAPLKLKQNFSLQQALMMRRSVRSFSAQNLNLEQLSQLLWAADGISEPKYGLRTAPSAGALFPLDLYVVKHDGVWRYNVAEHSLAQIAAEDLRHKLAGAALGQGPVAAASADFVITAEFDRITPKYGERGIRYSYIEAGHIAQNLMLEAVALGLASVAIGAFNDAAVKQVLALPKTQEPIYIIPVGYKK